MIYCANCGTQNIDGVKFCINCGAALTPASSSSTSQPGGWRSGEGGGLNDPASPEPERPATGSYINSFPQSAYPAYIPGSPGDPSGGGAGGYGGGFGTTYATWVERLPGGLIDLVLSMIAVGAVTFGAMAIAAVLGAVSGTLGDLAGCFGYLLGTIGYFAFGVFNKVYLVNQRGSSIGQGLTNLKVVTKENTTPPTGTLFIRLVASIVLGIIPCIGALGTLLDYLWPLWDEQRQTLHDKAAGTFVVKKS